MVSDIRGAFDVLDRRVIHALQLDARAPFSRIAEVLGVSDQTVARRYARLRAHGGLRVAGLPNPRALGQTWWTVRLDCQLEAAEDLAQALARRDDTLWVCLVSGGAELTLAVRGGEGEGGSPLLERLPRHRRVVRMTAHCHLHTFFGGSMSLVTKQGLLTAEQAARLHGAAPGPDDPDAPVPPLSEADRRLVAALTPDGRTPVRELAAATGEPATNVRRRLERLRATGGLYFDTEYDWRVFGLASRAMLWLSVAPARLAATGEALATHPEVAFCAATTGPSNLCAVVVCPDSAALYRYLTTRVAALPAIDRMETAPLTRTVKGISRRSPHPATAAARPHRPAGGRPAA
ncbi:Lrp/AsnC family transcriptional regulator [Streptomyces sp. 4N509B]|uniref:Lrp/AsnC family transcriptional regulator n=1 Tax=Streptomyces sp. 4N509B TaxID=3457413 RepID=UPI003FD3689E